MKISFIDNDLLCGAVCVFIVHQVCILIEMLFCARFISLPSLSLLLEEVMKYVCMRFVAAYATTYSVNEQAKSQVVVRRRSLY